MMERLRLRCFRHVQLGRDPGSRLRDYISAPAWERLGIPQSELADVDWKRKAADDG